MTKQAIPADVTPEDMEYARSYVQHFLDAMYASDRTLAVARVLDALLPPPPRPTLADMTASERNEHMWMQCEVEGIANLAVIVDPFWTKHTARVMWDDGVTNEEAADTVTPRPDLPRMTWPGDQQPDPAPALPDGWRLADHKDYGRVVVTNPTPTTDGHVHFVMPNPFDPLGYDWMFCRPAELTYIDLDQEADQ